MASPKRQPQNDRGQPGFSGLPGIFDPQLQCFCALSAGCVLEAGTRVDRRTSAVLLDVLLTKSNT